MVSSICSNNISLGFPPSSVCKESSCNVGEQSSIPGSGRSPGEGNGNPLLYSCLENPMDRGAWQALAHGVTRVGYDLVTQFSLFCLTLCNPMDCSTPGFPVHHQLLQLVQTHIHPVSDAIQPSHPLSSPSPPTFDLSQQQGLFQ